MTVLPLHVIGEELTRIRDTVRHELINTPETENFMEGVALEALHQQERWKEPHDDGKSPLDWFWLIGYLAQKAARAHEEGDTEIAQHHDRVVATDVAKAVGYKPGSAAHDILIRTIEVMSAKGFMVVES